MNQEAEPQETRSKTPARLLGVFLVLLGLGLTAGCYALLGTIGGFLFFGAWLGPFAFFLGAGCVVEGPQIPVKTLGPKMRVAAIVGTVTGLINVAVLSLL